MTVLLETTKCYCWLIERRDGQVFAFTDHDRSIDVTVDGQSHTYDPLAGLLTTKVSSIAGFESDSVDVEGSFQDESVTEADLNAGLFDEASVTIMLVNWKDTTEFKILVRGIFGEFYTTENGFRTELYSHIHRLSRVQGRVYQRNCDAELGDERCGVNIASAIHRTSTNVAVASGVIVDLNDLSAYSNGWFSLGTLRSAAGREYKIRSHLGNRVELWEVPEPPLAVSELVTLTSGCKKDSDTCRTKFSNIENFQGFGLFMPGQDALTNYPIQGTEVYNGGSIFR